MMIAQQTDLVPGEFIWSGGDVHIYKNHLEQVATQLSRQPLRLPTVQFLRRPESIYDYRIEDFQLLGYDPHPPIRAPISV
jgi:thymidylate synthase